jgi:hypothetical protein
MHNEIDAQIARLFSELPEADAEVSDRALTRALAALPTPRLAPRPPARTLAILTTAAVVLLASTAGALAAAGALHVSFGASSPNQKTATVSQLTVPPGARGIAAVVDGRLWLTTSSGFRLQGLPVTAAALSPHALYVAAGIGHALVAIAPDGHRAWSHPTAGPVAAIGWAPDGLRIAYVVAEPGGFRLHVIEGNGTRDELIDRAVRTVRPSWRADSLAVAYVAAGGRPVVYDLGHRSRRTISSPSARDATRLAFAPSGRALAVATQHGFLVTGAGGRANGGTFAPSLVAGLGWLDGQIALAINPASAGDQGPFIQLFRLDHGEAIPMGQLIPPAAVKALDASGRRLAIAVSDRSGIRVLASSPAATVTKAHLPQSPAVLQLAPQTRITTLTVR